MLKLIYFKMRALAEAPQLLLEYSGLEYEYLMSWDHFGDVWTNVKSKIPFQQLPMMEAEDGTQICQSIAILRFCYTALIWTHVHHDVLYMHMS